MRVVTDTAGVRPPLVRAGAPLKAFDARTELEVARRNQALSTTTADVCRPTCVGRRLLAPHEQAAAIPEAEPDEHVEKADLYEIRASEIAFGGEHRHHASDDEGDGYH